MWPLSDWCPLASAPPAPCLQSELEVEDAAADLLLGPADERETDRLHAVNQEEDAILA